VVEDQDVNLVEPAALRLELLGADNHSLRCVLQSPSDQFLIPTLPNFRRYRFWIVLRYPSLRTFRTWLRLSFFRPRHTLWPASTASTGSRRRCMLFIATSCDPIGGKPTKSNKRNGCVCRSANQRHTILAVCALNHSLLQLDDSSPKEFRSERILCRDRIGKKS
jgi:hypothetical protein